MPTRLLTLSLSLLFAVLFVSCGMKESSSEVTGPESIWIEPATATLHVDSPEGIAFIVKATYYGSPGGVCEITNAATWSVSDAHTVFMQTNGAAFCLQPSIKPVTITARVQGGKGPLTATATLNCL